MRKCSQTPRAVIRKNLNREWDPRKLISKSLMMPFLLGQIYLNQTKILQVRNWVNNKSKFPILIDHIIKVKLYLHREVSQINMINHQEWKLIVISILYLQKPLEINCKWMLPKITITITKYETQKVTLDLVNIKP